jgi:hypothetical protein
MKWLEPEAKEMDSALSRFDNMKVVYAHNEWQSGDFHRSPNPEGRKSTGKNYAQIMRVH